MSDERTPEQVIKDRKEAIRSGQAEEEQWLPVFDPLHPEASANFDGDAPEIVVGGHEEAEEVDTSVVTVKLDELNSLKAQAETARAVKEGIEGLASRIGAQPQAQPVNTPKKSAEEFYAEHAEEMYDPTKGAKLMRQYNKMVAEEEVGPIVSSLSTELAKTKRELLETRDPLFKKYAAEVDALVNSQPSNVRMQSNIYELAWGQVRQTHEADIRGELVKSEVKEQVQAALKELGLEIDEKTGKPKSQAQAKPPAYASGAGGRAPSQPVAGTRPRAVIKDAETEAKLRSEAKRRGMDFNDLLRAKGLLR